MTSLKSLTNKISDNIWEIPTSARVNMNVPVHIYTNDELFENLDDGVINQAMNVSSLPGLVTKMSVMPDGHWDINHKYI